MTNIMAAAALIASQIGAPLPVSAPAVVVPVAVAKEAAPVRAAASSGYVSATGFLSGNGYLQCSAPRGGSGWMSGSVNLTAQMPVNGPDGAYGTVPVSGYVYLTGSCQNGSGFVSGSASVNGYGTLYTREGKRAGTVQLNGSVFVSQYASGFVWINQYATVSGYFSADPAN
jgi:hypothetical protein